MAEQEVTGLGLIGGAEFLGFSNVGLEPNATYGTTIPFVLFAGFQLMFAAITPALISGAFAERKRFRSFVIFTVLWSLKKGDQVLFTSPRGAVVRTHMNHLIHHRGQLSVYLRLNDVPLPSIYGPTADEPW